ncbi:uncharacterized protein K02A2.6-like [Octopus bimaculoides]|uniref:uncharacterized protein K02A2.6-like n=1 Tax=Octopus bimaculoides TaxID=37653 RepID=UPI00071E2EE0|nr:uncharacterized protein K02A2.6-like [Octopus bimaculoides]|eukprot:XP_014776256.1 PREDICTED: uncharacterized protein K02A2.6-like [Octopus bimaculoides]
MFTVKHKTLATYHPRSNGQAERFVDTFKRALRKANKKATDKVTLQQFLRVFRVTLNPNSPAGNSPTELMCTRKVKSVFDKLLPGKERKSTRKDNLKFFKIGDEVYMRSYKNGKQYYKEGEITKYRGKMMHGIKSRKGTEKRYRNQLKKRFIENGPDRLEEPMEWLYDTFQVLIPFQVFEPTRTSGIKR